MIKLQEQNHKLQKIIEEERETISNLKKQNEISLSVISNTENSINLSWDHNYQEMQTENSNIGITSSENLSHLRGHKKGNKKVFDLEINSFDQLDLDNLPKKKKIVNYATFKVVNYFIDYKKKIIRFYAHDKRKFGIYMRFYCINSTKNCNKLYIGKYYSKGFLEIFEDFSECDCLFTNEELKKKCEQNNMSFNNE